VATTAGGWDKTGANGAARERGGCRPGLGSRAARGDKGSEGAPVLAGAFARSGTIETPGTRNTAIRDAGLAFGIGGRGNGECHSQATATA